MKSSRLQVIRKCSLTAVRSRSYPSPIIARRAASSPRSRAWTKELASPAAAPHLFLAASGARAAGRSTAPCPTWPKLPAAAPRSAVHCPQRRCSQAALFSSAGRSDAESRTAGPLTQVRRTAGCLPSCTLVALGAVPWRCRSASAALLT